MKYVDAITYKLITDEEVAQRVRIVAKEPQMVVYPSDLTVDYTLCSDEQFLEFNCNVLVVH